MKTYAPKGLQGSDLHDLMAELLATPAQVAKYLHVTERSVFRWLADENAPFAVLSALWHETPRGREQAAIDVGNEVVIQRGLARANEAAWQAETGRLARLLAICDTGAANDPFLSGPVAARGVERVQPVAQYIVGQVPAPRSPRLDALQPLGECPFPWDAQG